MTHNIRFGLCLSIPGGKHEGDEQYDYIHGLGIGLDKFTLLGFSFPANFIIPYICIAKVQKIKRINNKSEISDYMNTHEKGGYLSR